MMGAIENRLVRGIDVPARLFVLKLDKTDEEAATLEEQSQTAVGRQEIAALPEIDLNPEDVI